MCAFFSVPWRRNISSIASTTGVHDCQLDEIRTMIPPGVLVVTLGTIHENNKRFSGSWSVESLRAPGGRSALSEKCGSGSEKAGSRAI